MGLALSKIFLGQQMNGIPLYHEGYINAQQAKQPQGKPQPKKQQQPAPKPQQKPAPK